MSTSERAFAGTAAQVGEARRWAARRLAGAGVPEDTADTAALCVSELATNAVKYTLSGIESGRFRVRVITTRGVRLRIEVRDEGPLPGRPVTARTAADPLPDGGRGLLLVRELAAESGGDGSVRWFRMPWQDPTAVPAPARSPEEAGVLW